MGNIFVNPQKSSPAIDNFFSFQAYLIYNNVLTTILHASHLGSLTHCFYN